MLFSSSRALLHTVAPRASVRCFASTTSTRLGSSSAFAPAPASTVNKSPSGIDQLLDITEDMAADSPDQVGPDSSSILQHLSRNQIISPQHLSPRHLLIPYLPRPNFSLAHPLGPPTEFGETHDPFVRYGVDPLTDVSSLNSFWKSEFVTTMGKLKPRGKTGLQRKSQRRVGKAIRRARSMGIAPSFGISVPGTGGERY
ncbi:mitochondrial 37S ribosomal protein bS18m RSM18 [Sporobolomyces koalae]|uniref:mitochondrial 37S ribosomal protein bS18m RSM18 n=1 Tax=Sporobolomyces koalae TaxID=500713 RepID=UPI003182AED3